MEYESILKCKHCKTNKDCPHNFDVLYVEKTYSAFTSLYTVRFATGLGLIVSEPDMSCDVLGCRFADFTRTDNKRIKLRLELVEDFSNMKNTAINHFIVDVTYRSPFIAHLFTGCPRARNTLRKNLELETIKSHIGKVIGEFVSTYYMRSKRDDLVFVHIGQLVLQILNQSFCKVERNYARVMGRQFNCRGKLYKDGFMQIGDAYSAEAVYNILRNLEIPDRFVDSYKTCFHSYAHNDGDTL